MDESEFRKNLFDLGLQKAEIERRGISDLHFHCSMRTKVHRRIGKLMQEEIDSGKRKTKVISEFSQLLKEKFPGVRGFSKTNLGTMLNLYNDYKDDPELESLSDEIPVSQNSVISSFCKTREERKLVLTGSVFGELQSKRKLEAHLRECRKSGMIECPGFFKSSGENAACNGGFSLSRELVFDVSGNELEQESVKSLMKRKIPDIHRKKIQSGFVRIHIRNE